MENLNEIKKLLAQEDVRQEFENLNKYSLSFEFERDYLFAHLVSSKVCEKVNKDDVPKVLYDCALHGLTLDPSLNYSYIALREFDGKLTPVYDIGYQGMISRMSMLSGVVDVFAVVVFEKDFFSANLGLEPALKHTPYYFQKIKREERGNPTGAYAVVVFDSGYRKFDYLEAARIVEIRAESADYKADKKNGTNLSPWNNSHWPEMWQKTVIKHIYKTIPKLPIEQSLVASKEVVAEFEIDNRNRGFDSKDSSAMVEIAKTAGKIRVEDDGRSKQEKEIQKVINKGKQEDEVKPTPEKQDSEEKHFSSEAGLEIPPTIQANVPPESLKEEKPKPPPNLPTRQEVESIYHDSKTISKLKNLAINLGILDRIEKNSRAKRLGTKVLRDGIIDYIDEMQGVPEEKKKQIKRKEPVEDITSKIAALQRTVREFGLKSFAKVTLQIINMMNDPAKDIEGMRSQFSIDVLLAILEHYDAADELEKHIGSDPHEFIISASNKKIKDVLQTV